MSDSSGQVYRAALSSRGQRYVAEVTRLSADLALQREQSRQLQTQIDGLVSKDASELAGFDQKISSATALSGEARKSLRSAADGNPIYRLAANWYGVSTANVTPEQLATARRVFSTFSAFAVALAGSIAALVYYARNRIPGTPSSLGGLITKVARARRAYYARKRKPLKPLRLLVSDVGNDDGARFISQRHGLRSRHQGYSLETSRRLIAWLFSSFEGGCVNHIIEESFRRRSSGLDRSCNRMPAMPGTGLCRRRHRASRHDRAGSIQKNSSWPRRARSSRPLP
jgi:hypothetical protein